MNPHDRRRQRAMDRQNSFYSDYVRHLPRSGPDAIGKPGVHHDVLHHDPDCSIYDGEGCNCEPEVEMFSEPQRA
jgi:hypothetical protein